jgi:hypothetical protein
MHNRSFGVYGKWRGCAVRSLCGGVCERVIATACQVSDVACVLVKVVCAVRLRPRAEWQTGITAFLTVTDR